MDATERGLAMSTITTHISEAPRAGFFGRIAAAFYRARMMQANRIIFRQTMRELGRLSDRELEDLGITPDMIEAVARKAVHGI